MKFLKIIAVLSMLPSACFGYAHWEGYCQQGGQKVVTSSVQSTTQVQQSYPSATLTAYITGSSPLTKATIYSDNAGTPSSNPLTCSSKGYFSFWSGSGLLDLTFSGAGVPAPFTWGAVSGQEPMAVVTDVDGRDLGDLCALAVSLGQTLQLYRPHETDSGSCAANIQWFTGGKVTLQAMATYSFTGNVDCPQFQWCWDSTTNSGSFITFGKMPENLNPVQYGADASGVSDSTSKVQATINAANGRFMHWPAAIFRHTGLTHGATVSIHGANAAYNGGSANTILLYTLTGTGWAAADPSQFPVVDLKNLFFQKDGAQGGIGMSTAGYTRGSLIEQCTFDNFTTGMWMDAQPYGTYFTRIVGNYISGTATGILMTGGNSGQPNSNTISDNTFFEITTGIDTDTRPIGNLFERNDTEILLGATPFGIRYNGVNSLFIKNWGEQSCASGQTCTTAFIAGSGSVTVSNSWSCVASGGTCLSTGGGASGLFRASGGNAYIEPGDTGGITMLAATIATETSTNIIVNNNAAGGLAMNSSVILTNVEQIKMNNFGAGEGNGSSIAWYHSGPSISGRLSTYFSSTYQGYITEISNVSNVDGNQSRIILSGLGAYIPNGVIVDRGSTSTGTHFQASNNVALTSIQQISLTNLGAGNGNGSSIGWYHAGGNISGKMDTFFSTALDGYVTQFRNTGNADGNQIRLTLTETGAQFTGGIQNKGTYAYASIPARYACSGANYGMWINIIDSTVGTYRAAITTGGGGQSVPAWCNGTDYESH